MCRAAGARVAMVWPIQKNHRKNHWKKRHALRLSYPDILEKMETASELVT
jgi:hypothetical protein